MYSATQEQFDRAWDILDAYEKATESEGRGAVMFGDEMIDEASRKMAMKFVSRGERAGLRRSKGSTRARLRRRSRRRRATTLSASVSSAPSKIDSTRASTK